MSRSLFAILNQRFGTSMDSVSRRQFLKASQAFGAGLLLSSAADANFKANATGRRVVVVGAGFSGLACAYELRSRGYDVTVVEARRRVGGRVRSFNKQLGAEFIPNRTVEGGGELIGLNHPLWLTYADRFRLRFLPVSEGDAEAPIVLDGKRLTTAESERLWQEMASTLSRMNQAALPINADAPWNSPDAQALDKRSLHEWIEDQTDVSPLCRTAVAAQETANNGVDTRLQSYLGNLAMVKGGGLQKYWTESEVYRCHGGNQQLAQQFAHRIGSERLLTGVPVQRCEQRGEEMIVTCATGRILTCEEVVYTAPPSTWSKVVFHPPLPAELKPQMGVNLKYLAYVKNRFWKGIKLAPDSLTDGPLSMTWEGTDNQLGNTNVSLNCFSGGPAAEACLQFPPGQRDVRYAEILESLYPGFGKQFVKSRFMNWPRDPWTLAGYSFPAPGEVTTVGPRLAAGLGNLHFAGEHACYKFAGYMEGALSSGVHVARVIAAKDASANPDSEH